MKKTGLFVRLLTVVAALALTAFAVTGCGNKDNASKDAGPDAKQFQSGEQVGKAGKVEVKSDDKMSVEQQAVVTRIGDFADATDSHNYKRLCSLLSKEAQKIGGDCEKTFKKSGQNIKDFKIVVNSVTVAEDGKTATAKVDVSSNTGGPQDAQTLTLVKQGGEWKIQILGQ